MAAVAIETVGMATYVTATVAMAVLSAVHGKCCYGNGCYPPPLSTPSPLHLFSILVHGGGGEIVL